MMTNRNLFNIVVWSRALSVAVVLAGVTTMPTSPAWAIRQNARSEAGQVLRRPHFLDRKGLRPGSPPARPAARPSDAARAALTRLQGDGPRRWHIDWDAEKGTPAMVTGGMAGPYPGAPEAAARAFLRQYADLFNLDRGGDLRFDRTLTSKGGHHVGFVQHRRGLPVIGGTIHVLVDREGFVRMASGGFHPLPDVAPYMSVAADVALRGVLRRIDPGVEMARDVRPLPPPAGLPAYEVQDYTPDDILPADMMILGRVRPALYPTADDLRIVWMVDVRLADTWQDLRVLVDAEDGEPLDAMMLSHTTGEDIRVYDRNPDRSPLTVEQIPLADKSNLGGPLDENFTVLYNAQAPVIADAPYTGPADPNDPFFNLNFDEQNVYWHNNKIRQFFRDLNGGPLIGLIDLDTEPLGSTVHRVDSGEPNVDNASYSRLTDISSFGHGTFHLGLLFGLRDLALEDSVVYHEYSHRINDNIAGFSGSSIFDGASNEAFADYWAAAVSNDRYIGEFANADAEVGDDSGWLGFNGFIRSMDNDRVYSQLCDNPFITGGCEVHSDGEILAGALWDLHQRLIAARGGTEGRAIAFDLFLEALFNMSGGGPFDSDDFIESRNAILTADSTLFAGDYECLIWEVFAGRELGAGSTSAVPPTVSTSLPTQCIGNASVAFSRPFFNCSAPDSGIVNVSDPDGGAVTFLNVTTASGDSETLSLTWAAGSASTPAFDIEVSTPSSGDGIVQVSSEDERILATYTDDSPSGARFAATEVDCSPDVRLASSRLFNGSCAEADDPFLDGGESALLEVVLELSLDAPVGSAPLEIDLTLVSSNANVRVVAPATQRAAVTPVVEDIVELRATFALSGDVALTAGETVDLDVLLGGPGISGAQEPIQLTQTLEQDLSFTPRSFVFNFIGGTEEFFTGMNGPSGTETWFWQTASCAAPPDPGYWHQGGNNCTNYSLGDNSWLVSPFVRFQDATAAFPSRLTELRFQHRVDFGAAASAAPFIENEHLEDPASLQQLPFVYDSTDNTVGFEQVIIDLSNLPPGMDLSHGWVRFRWLFIGDDGSGGATGDGWFVDDVEIRYEEPSVVSDGSTAVACAPTVSLDLAQVQIGDPLIEAGSGNGNGTPDPGETIQLPLILANNGTGVAESLVGTLSSDRPDIINITDATAGFPNIFPTFSASSIEPHYTFEVDPTATCGDVVRFTLTLDHNDTPGASMVSFTLRIGSLQPAPTALFYDNFETDTLAWTVDRDGTDTATTGVWERADSTLNYHGDDSINNNETQPLSDFDPGLPAGLCYITEDGGAPYSGHDVDGGATTLTSASFDLSTAADPSVSYARWVYNREGNPLDAFLVEVSNDDGASWTLIESVSDFNGIPRNPVTNLWLPQSFLISDFLPLTDQMRFRFTAQDQSGQIIEAAVDAFEIRDTVPVCPQLPAEVSPVGSATPLMVSKSGPMLTLSWEAGENADTYRVITGDIADLAAQGGVVQSNASPTLCRGAALFSLLPEPPGPTFFLVAGENLEGVGPLGTATSGISRRADSTCP